MPDDRHIEEAFFEYAKDKTRLSPIDLKAYLREAAVFCHIREAILGMTDVNAVREIMQRVSGGKLLHFQYGYEAQNIRKVTQLYYSFLKYYHEQKEKAVADSPASTEITAVTQKETEYSQPDEKKQKSSRKDEQSFRFTKPVSFTYNGVKHEVKTWSGLYVEICKLLFIDYHDAFMSIINGDVPGHHALSFADEQHKDRMNNPLSFAEGYYLEANRSADVIAERIRGLSQLFNLGDKLEINHKMDQAQQQEKPILFEEQSITNQSETKLDHPKKQMTIMDAVFEVTENCKSMTLAEVYQAILDRNLYQFKPEDNLDTIRGAILEYCRSTETEGCDLCEIIEEEVHKADLEGITVEQVALKLGISVRSVKKAIQESVNVVVIEDRLIHKEAFVDWEDGADRLESILEKLMKKNNGYVSDVQLYEYARVEMQMFLNDNDLNSRRKVFDIAEHLFEKEHYHGRKYTFWMKTHISKGKETITSKLDIILKYAREEGGCFREEELEAYLNSLGIKTGSLRQQMKVYDEPIFLFYEPGVFITKESIGIDDNWLEKAKAAIEKLFADAGDHIVLRDIQPWWYDLLPQLPGDKP